MNNKKSLWKWNAGLWNRLEKKRQRSPSQCREDIFMKMLWEQCDYCRYYKICKVCPLHKQRGCYGMLGFGDFLTSIMYNTWTEDDREAFEEARKKFYQMIKDSPIPDDKNEEHEGE